MAVKKIKWLDNHIEVEPVKNPKKITATRLAAILGLNRWSTPFKAWCEITRTYEEPFEDNQYTLAGKAIEPILIKMLEKRYFMDIQDPTDVYGPDYFKKTWGDFFRDVKVFGGMWDAIGDNTIVEIKTTKRAEDWLEDTPEYYKAQAALYAYLSGCENIIFVCGFLTDEDYQNPGNFKPVVGKNTIIRDYKMSEIYPDFENTHIKPAAEFWKNHVETGISPDYDEKADADIIAALRKTTADVNEDIAVTLKRIDELKEKIAAVSVQLDPLEKELKAAEEQLKTYLKSKFTDGIDKVNISSSHYCFTLAKSQSENADTAKLKKAGLWKEYSTVTTTYRLTNKIIEKNEEEKS